MDQDQADVPKQTSKGLELTDVRKRFDAICSTLPRGRILTNADYAQLGLEPFLPDDFVPESRKNAAASTSKVAATPGQSGAGIEGSSRRAQASPRTADFNESGADDDDFEEPCTERRAKSVDIGPLLRQHGYGPQIPGRRPEAAAAAARYFGKMKQDAEQPPSPPPKEVDEEEPKGKEIKGGTEE